MKKIISMLLCVAMILSIMSGVGPIRVTEAAGNVSALSPTKNNLVQATNAFTSAPRTFEATIELPESQTERAGAIIGNYTANRAGNPDSFVFEIHKNGVPRLYYWDIDNLASYDFQFTGVNVCKGRPIKLTIVHDSSAVHCYVDGELQKSITSVQVNVSDLPEFNFTDAPVVGGDLRSGNKQYFKGYIYDVAVWSDVRSEEEIANNSIDTIDQTDEKLLVAYDFSSSTPSQDLSTNQNHLPEDKLNISTYDGVYTNTDTTKGLNFNDPNRVYQTEKKLSGNPYTLSTWVYLPKEYTARGGVILGNFRRGTNVLVQREPSVNFEISANGVPRFYHVNSDKNIIDLKFSGINICADKWVNLTFVVDENSNTVSCYLDGIFRGKKSSTYDIRMSDAAIPYGLGGDMRGQNAQNFKGRILEMAMYDEVLSASDIWQLYLGGVSTLVTTPFANYTLTDAKQEDDIQDITGNENRFLSKLRYFSEKTPVTDYAYSFAVIGDTQTVTDLDIQNGTQNLAGIYDWILENKEEKKIEFVLGLGDITEHVKPDHEQFDAEWTLALSQISRLNDKIPYSLVRGNHDEANAFNDYLGETYRNQLQNGGFYQDDDICNAWRTFTVGSVDYLMLMLDYGAKDDVLAWADGIIEQHPTHNVIITTHAYLFRDGTTLDDEDLYPPKGELNNGEEMWQKLVSKHENIVLIMSGHDPYDKVVVTQNQGIHGNTVTQMLSDHQYVDHDEAVPTGMVTMLYFSEDGSRVQVECFSTVNDKFFLEENQFTMDLDVVDSATFTSAWVDIEDSLALNYKVKLTGDAAKTTPVITIDGPGADVKNVPMTKVSGELNTWTYRYSDIMAQEMADTITATVSAGDVTATKAYSVLEYCKAVLEKEDAAFATEYGYTTEQCAAVRELIVDLVQYGGQVQQYRGATDTLSQKVTSYAHYDKNDNLVELSELTSLRDLTDNTDDTTYQWSGVTLTLKEKINIRAKFSANNIDNLKVQIKVGNTIKEDAAITEASNGTYYVYFNGLCAEQYGDEITFTFIDSSTDQPIGKTLHYSVNSYLKNMCTNESVSNLLEAINEYGHAAKAFVSLMNVQ